MNILFVLFNEARNGVNTSFSTLMNFLNNRSFFNNHTVTVLTLTGCRSDFECSSLNNIAPKEFEFIKNLRKPLKDVVLHGTIYEKTAKVMQTVAHKMNISEYQIYDLIFKRLEKIDECYDVAIAYQEGLPTWYVYNKINATKKIAWYHVDPNVFLKNKLYIDYYNSFDNVICVSDYARKSMVNILNTGDDKIKYIRGVINPERVKALANREKLHSDNLFTICTVGRLSTEKGFDIILDCACRMHNKFPFQWYIVGDGYLKENITKIVSEKCLDEIHLIGDTDNPYKYIKNCDIYVQMSRHEGAGNTLYEALILGKTFIVSDIPSFKEIGGDNGFYCGLNCEELAEKIQYLYNNLEIIHQKEKQLLTYFYNVDSEIDKLMNLIV